MQKKTNSASSFTTRNASYIWPETNTLKFNKYKCNIYIIFDTSQKPNSQIQSFCITNINTYKEAHLSLMLWSAFDLILGKN